MVEKNKESSKTSIKNLKKSEKAAPLETDKAKPIPEGQTFAISDLSPAAANTLAFLQFVQARLKVLNGEMVVCQTAQRAYLSALKEELNQAPGTSAAIKQSP
jgi:hypothetical protein